MLQGRLTGATFDIVIFAAIGSGVAGAAVLVDWSTSGLSVVLVAELIPEDLFDVDLETQYAP